MDEAFAYFLICIAGPIVGYSIARFVVGSKYCAQCILAVEIFFIVFMKFFI
jgi:hypothetical protein